MNVSIENGEMIIRLKVNNPPTLSSTGKTLTLASTHGFTDAGITHNDKPVKINVNAFIKP